MRGEHVFTSSSTAVHHAVPRTFLHLHSRISFVIALIDSINVIQGDHFPDHVKLPDFSLTFPVEASKDYRVLSVYRYGQQWLFHINEKQGEAR